MIAGQMEIPEAVRDPEIKYTQVKNTFYCIVFDIYFSANKKFTMLIV